MRYDKDINFFKNLKNPNMLYVLGFFAADGHIGKNRFQISVSIKDRLILESIRSSMGSDSKLIITLLKTENNIKTGEMIKLDVCSKEIVEDLKRLGFSSRKTYDGFSLPDVEDELLWHFLRGYFDGDGHFSYRNIKKVCKDKLYDNKCYKFEICSKTNKCLIEISEFLRRYNILSNIRFDTKKSVYYLSAGGKNNVYNLFSKLYHNPSLYLERKYNKFLEADFNIKVQGVYRYKDRFKASIRYKNKSIFLGIFDNIELAIKYRDGAAYILNGPLAKLNSENNRRFPEKEYDYLIKRVFDNP